MRIGVVGTGYVGLVVGGCLSEMGNDVVCIDIDAKKIDALRRGDLPLFEPGLAEIVLMNQRAGRLKFTTDLGEAVRHAQVVFIAVSTPQDRDGSADLSAVKAVAEGVGAAISNEDGGYKVIVMKSTVPVGTADEVRRIIASRTKHAFDVVSNPEFLKEGNAVNDFMKPDRVVIGADTEKARALVADLYAPFVRTENPVLFMSVRSAELTKYASNAFLATRISFMNDIANLCEAVGADVAEVRRGMGADARIGYAFLFPGVGYGGSCFPKDVRALIHTAKESGHGLSILEAVDGVNNAQRGRFADRIVAHFGGSLAGRVVAVWGLAFKPRTDDMREAPAVTIIERLLAAGAVVKAHDPVAISVARRMLGERVQFCESNYDTIDGADALAVVTEWNEFRRPDFERMKRQMRTPVIFDGRNLFEPARMRELGFTYYGVGRI
ncbi:MAG: UDP-glucose/GDP-mannose dehydrogenase family protein [Deltaproteobacteria bacterium]|nr:UDP-glucose/GDP-mannose dehydrogenase family protein [Deltaproteobacteria bacterium]